MTRGAVSVQGNGAEPSFEKSKISTVWLKWSQKTGQSFKVCSKPMKGYENGEATECPVKRRQDRNFRAKVAL